MSFETTRLIRMVIWTLPTTTSCPLTRPAENSSWETPSAVSGEGITVQILGQRNSTQEAINTVQTLPQSNAHTHTHRRRRRKNAVTEEKAIPLTSTRSKFKPDVIQLFPRVPVNERNIWTHLSGFGWMLSITNIQCKKPEEWWMWQELHWNSSPFLTTWGQ